MLDTILMYNNKTVIAINTGVKPNHVSSNKVITTIKWHEIRQMSYLYYIHMIIMSILIIFKLWFVCTIDKCNLLPYCQ